MSAEDEKKSGETCNAKDIALIVMSFISQTSAIIVCGVIIFHPPDMTNATVATLVGTVIGFLISEAKNFSSYWTGSTRSSSDKDKTIAAMQPPTGTGTGTATTATITPAGATITTQPAPKPGDPPLPDPALEKKIKDLTAQYVASGMAQDEAEKLARQNAAKVG